MGIIFRFVLGKSEQGKRKVLYVKACSHLYKGNITTIHKGIISSKLNICSTILTPTLFETFGFRGDLLLPGELKGKKHYNAILT